MNKSHLLSSSLLLGLVFSLSSCFNNAPNFPETPKISKNDVEFKEGNTPLDSLIITIRYQDGNGDLGVDETFTNGDFAPGFYYTFNNGDTISIGDIGKPINIPGFDGDVVPPYEKPYSCINWVGLPVLSGQVIKDTLFYVPNPNNFNIFIKIFHRPIGSASDVKFEEYTFANDLSNNVCGTINGRFPILKNLSESAAPIEGTLRYAMASSGWLLVLQGSEIYLEVQIQDRVFNRSNVIKITGRPDNDNGTGFTLAQIKTN